jgi:hypothetical protein
MGISENPIEELIPFARFWLSPPNIKIYGNGYSFDGFNKNERAYHISKVKGKNEELKFSVLADAESPVVNPVFIVRNWGNQKPHIKLDGGELLGKEQFRYSINKKLNERNLIVWMNINSVRETEISITTEGE